MFRAGQGSVEETYRSSKLGNSNLWRMSMCQSCSEVVSSKVAIKALNLPFDTQNTSHFRAERKDGKMLNVLDASRIQEACIPRLPFSYGVC